MTADPRVPLERLHRPCDPSGLGFVTTAELDVPETVPVGQDEALAALAFGVSVTDPGYNVFVLGAPGSGRFSFTRRLVEQRARGQPSPPDVCYVFNFDDPRRPRALEVPTGRGSSKLKT